MASLRALSYLPLSALQRLGSWLGSLLYVLNGSQRQTTEANLSHCFPDRTPAERDALVRASLRESGKVAVEMAAIWHWPRHKTESLIHVVNGLPLLEAALAKKKGVILLTPHLGNWEMVGFFAAQVARVTSLYAPASLPALDRLMYEGRTRNGSSLVPTNAAGVKALLKALKAGEITIILPDQVPEEGSGVFAPFLGQPVYTMTLLTSLAQRTGAEVLCCYARRRENGSGFDIEILPAHEQIASHDEQCAAEALNLSVERCTRSCPDQYQWEYKRFRKDLRGKVLLYREDRRMEARRQLCVAVEVLQEENQGWAGTLLNVHLGGLMLNLTQALQPGELYRVRLHMPEGETVDIPLEIQCLWCRATQATYVSGFAITFCSPAAARQLLRLLEQWEQRPWNVQSALLCWKLVARTLPLSVLRGMEFLWGSAQVIFKTQYYRHTLENIQCAFSERDALSQQQLVRRCLQQQGPTELPRYWIHMTSARELERPQCVVRCDEAALDVLQTAMEKPSGAVLLVPDIGLWVLALRYLARRYPLTLLYQPRAEYLKDRTFYRAVWRDGYSACSIHDEGIDQGVRLLQTGQLLALLPDNLSKRQKYLTAPFFSCPRSVMNVALWKATTQASVFCVYLEVEPGLPGYKLQVELLQGLEECTEAGQGAAILYQAMEQAINKNSGLYGWHRRIYARKYL